MATTSYLLLSLLALVLVVDCKMSNLKSVEFEVFGKVQGVFFRKYTMQEATRLGLRGWCMNTDDGTVKGVLEGPVEAIKEMKIWLQTKGSRTSRIDRAEFRNEKDIANYSFKDFNITR